MGKMISMDKKASKRAKNEISNKQPSQKVVQERVQAAPESIFGQPQDPQIGALVAAQMQVSIYFI